MREITIEDCIDLLDDFITYTETAQPYEFPVLIMIDRKLQQTIEKFKEHPDYDQKELRSMFRAVLRVIGQDYSEYMEAQNE